jgi:hypothetical protein
MENQFRVINRVTREEQVFNSAELRRFFYCEYDHQTQKVKYNNEWNDYAISSVKSPIHSFLENIFYAFCAVVFIVCTTKIIMQWI